MIDLHVGAVVQHRDRVFRIVQFLDFGSVIGLDVTTNLSERLPVAELKPLESDISAVSMDIDEIGDADWREAQRRFDAIRPLLADPGNRTTVQERAKTIGVDVATLYRWLQRYRTHGDVTALIPQTRGRRPGKYHLPPATEEIIREVRDTLYLTHEKPSKQKIVDEVIRTCKGRNVAPPSPNTVRTRLQRISERTALRGRGEAERARNLYTPKPGSFPGADYPLAVVQIDHTPVDLILVDDETREPMSRPWLTLAMDVCTRMVVGYYLSLDPPSFLSIGMCMAHAMLPKERWLMLHGIKADWPVWGAPVTLHSDNGPDFKGENLKASCAIYNINHEFRPVKRPHFGGHIERLLGTFMREVHAIPGTTFSSIKSRGEYDSAKNAVMTLGEFEVWLVTLITKSYHQKIHSKLGVSPIRAWERGIHGYGDKPGIGLPARPADPDTVLRDFLECFHRTVQPDGVTIDGVSYYDNALRPWINAKNAENSSKKRSFIFRRDPRDISTIWFLDPDLKRYFKIPYADQRHPAMSIWVFQRARAKLLADGKTHLDQQQIFDAAEEMSNIEAAAKRDTAKKRRQAQKNKEHKRGINPASPFLKPRADVEDHFAISDAALNSNPPKIEGWMDGDFDFVGDIA